MLRVDTQRRIPVKKVCCDSSHRPFFVSKFRVQDTTVQGDCNIQNPDRYPFIIDFP